VRPAFARAMDELNMIQNDVEVGVQKTLKKAEI
jgi:hypothetical protein